MTTATKTHATRAHAKHPLRKKKLPGPHQPDEHYDTGDFLDESFEILGAFDAGTIVAPTSFAVATTDLGPDTPLGPLKKRLTPDQEKILAWRIQTYGDVDARNLFVTKNMGLIHLVAKQYTGTNKHSDMLQEGVFGLIRAAELFDPRAKVRFATYAMHWIRAKVQRFNQRLNKDDTPNINDGSEIYTIDARTGRKYRRRVPNVSLDAPAANSDADDAVSLGECTIDNAPSPFDFVAAKECAEQMQRVVKEITEAGVQKTRGEGVSLMCRHFEAVVKLRMLAEEPATLEEVGDALNLSREGVRLVEKKLFQEIKKRVLSAVPGVVVPGVVEPGVVEPGVVEPGVVEPVANRPSVLIRRRVAHPVSVTQPTPVLIAQITPGCPFTLPPEGVNLDDVQRGLFQQALARTKGNHCAAARLLGISRYAVRYRVEQVTKSRRKQPAVVAAKKPRPLGAVARKALTDRVLAGTATPVEEQRLRDHIELMVAKAAEQGLEVVTSATSIPG